MRTHSPDHWEAMFHESSALALRQDLNEPVTPPVSRYREPRIEPPILRGKFRPQARAAEPIGFAKSSP